MVKGDTTLLLIYCSLNSIKVTENISIMRTNYLSVIFVIVVY